MGGEDSKPQQENYEEDEEYFLVEEMERMKLPGTGEVNYFWIDPHIYNSENQKNQKYFDKHLKIEQFTSVESVRNELEHLDPSEIVKVISAASLKEDDFYFMASEKMIAEIYLFCQNQERAKLLQGNFPKIKGVAYNAEELVNLIRSRQGEGPSKLSMSTNALFMTDDDTNLMNKYRLNYYCLTNQSNKSKSKEDFVNLAKKFYPEANLAIKEFEENYSLALSEEQRLQQTTKWAFRNSFYWDLIDTVPKSTIDPKKLAYLRLPVKDLYEAVSWGYRSMKKKFPELFLVIDLNEEEVENLEQSKNDFIIFTTFVKGYTSEAEALKEFKRRGESAYFFEVLPTKKKVEEKLDFGYLINPDKEVKANVIFNIYNFFKVDEVNTNRKIRRGVLMYGSLAEIFKKRADPDVRNKIKDNELALLRNYDYLEDLMAKIKNQGNILQFSGFYRESVSVYDRKLEQITRTNKPAAMLDEFRIEKGDSLRMNEEFEASEKVYSQVETEKLRLVAKVRILELQFKREDEAAIARVVGELEREVQRLREWSFMEDYFRAKNYIGLFMLKQGKNRDASKLYKELRKEVSDYYDYKLEGIPLVHEIYRNFGLSETKNSNYESALTLLNSTKDWSKSCEGRGPTLILNEKLIQNVYHSKGDKDMVEETQTRIDELQGSTALSGPKLINASRGSVSAQQNIQQSLVAIDLNASAQKKPPVQIEQSAVNVSLGDKKAPSQAPVNIEQSAVNVNLDKPIHIDQSAVGIDL